MTSSGHEPSGATRALADVAFGSRTHVADTSRPLAWMSAEELAIDLDDPDQRRFGDYELVEQIGAGGMGVVYRARQHGLERDVALKLLAAGPWASDEFVARFRREARSAARMQHPNIVEIYEFGEKAGLNWFSMRLIDGESLADRLQREGPMPAIVVARLLRTVAEAIDYAHRLGVLHLDLKPANVLLTRTGEPLVADFGLARRIDAGHDGGGEISGTPSFMAPEQATLETHPLSASTDIHGLGATLYAMLTGRPPFQAGDAQSTLEHVVTRAPARPRAIRADIPADLEAICLTCLQKDPADRYPTARALADDLGRFLDGRPVSVRPLSPTQRIVRWARREPRVAAAVGVAFVALVVGASVTTVLWREAEASRALADAERLRAEASAADMAKAVDLSVNLFTSGDADDDVINRRAASTVAWLEQASGGDERLLSRILGAFTASLARMKGPDGAQSILAPVVEKFGAPFRERIAAAWDARGGAGDLSIAAIWSRPYAAALGDNWRGTGPKVLPMGRFAERVRRAHERDPRDPMPLFLAALFCDPAVGACAIEGAPRALAAMEPDNAANWALAADRTPGDAAQVREYLAHAASATVFDDRLDELFELYRRGLDDSGVPLPETMRRPLEAASGSDRPAFLPIYWEFQLRPVFSQQPFVELCDPSGNAIDPGLRADCIAYATLLVDSRGGLLHNHVGQTMLRRLLKGTDAERALVDRRRQYLWMTQAEGVLQVVAERGGGWEVLMRDAARVGELEAYFLRMERLGHRRLPPAGWQPRNPEDLLLPEDRAATR